MPPSNPVTSPTRRAYLAACGTGLLAGCSESLALKSSEPPIECGPASYSWPMYGYNPSRTSHLAARELPSDSAEARRLTETGSSLGGGGSVEGPPVIDAGVAYAAGDVRIEARDTESGERLWAHDPDDSVSTSPVLACGSLFVSAANETLSLNPDDGTVLWRADSGSHSGASASPVAVDDTIYVVASGINALDAETGDEQWHVRGDHAAHGIAVEDRVYIGAGSNGSGSVTAVTRDGDEWWQTTEPGEVYTAPAVANEAVFAVSKAGTLTALAANDGSVEWQVSVESGIHEPPAVGNGIIVVEAGNGNRTMAFDVKSGHRLWTYQTGVSSGGPVIVGDRVLATGANTGIHLLNAATGDLVRHWPVENVGSQPVVSGGRLFYRGWNFSDVVTIG